MEINKPTIGKAWLATCRAIVEKGISIKDGSRELKELMHVTIRIKKPSMEDSIVARHGDPAMIEWMLSNFLEQKRVPELKNALSYGTRLFNFSGKNQIDWVVQKLAEKPESKAATIPLILPDDDGYIPCVSLLDFKIRNDSLTLTAACRAIDFGAKAYANMLALHRIQQLVAERLKLPCGELVMNVISAHIYEEQTALVKEVLTHE